MDYRCNNIRGELTIMNITKTIKIYQKKWPEHLKRMAEKQNYPINID
jgi:hypothetical protein